MFRPSFLVRRGLAFAVVLSSLLVALAVPFSAAATGPVTTFSFNLGSSCVRGTSAANAQLHVVLRSSTGQYQGHFTVTADGSGNWGSRCFWGGIDATDQIIATDGSNTRTFVVQPIKHSVNRVTDVIAGTSVPHSSVEIFVMNCQDSWYSCNSAADQIRPTSASGAFSFDFSNAYDIRGGDYTQVHWMSPQGDDEYDALYAPQLNAWLGNQWSWGDAKGGGDAVTVWLFDRHGNQRAKAHDRASSYGYFETAFHSGGNVVNIALNDFVVSNVATDATIKVRSFHPTYDTTNDVITAHCFRNGAYYLDAQRPDNSASFNAVGVADGSGNISVNTLTAGSYDLQSDDTFDITCRNPRGDQLEETFQVP